MACRRHDSRVAATELAARRAGGKKAQRTIRRAAIRRIATRIIPVFKHRKAYMVTFVSACGLLNGTIQLYQKYRALVGPCCAKFYNACRSRAQDEGHKARTTLQVCELAYQEECVGRTATGLPSRSLI